MAGAEHRHKCVRCRRYFACHNEACAPGPDVVVVQVGLCGRCFERDASRGWGRRDGRRPSKYGDRG